MTALWWEEFLPEEEMDPTHRRAIERARTMTAKEQIEIFEQIAPGNPYAQSILDGLRRLESGTE